MVGSGWVKKATLEHNLPFPFHDYRESVMEDIAQIIASILGQSFRLSFMYPSCTLIFVMMTKKTTRASQTKLKHMVITMDEPKIE